MIPSVQPTNDCYHFNLDSWKESVVVRNERGELRYRQQQCTTQSKPTSRCMHCVRISTQIIDIVKCLALEVSEFWCLFYSSLAIDWQYILIGLETRARE